MLARLDGKRKKRMSNEEWKSPADGDARIAKMKDGRTRLAHKAEHAVDLDTGAVVAVTLQGADHGDTTTLDRTLSEAGIAVAEQIGCEAEARPLDKPKLNVKGIEELVTDKGYHSGAVVGRNNRRCTRIGGGCGVSTAGVSCDGGASWWNAALHTASLEF